MDLIRDFLRSRNPEQTIFEHFDALIRRTEETEPPRFRDGSKLRVLLAGYLGAGNLGSEIRSQEIARHINFILGPENVCFTVIGNGSHAPAELVPNKVVTTLKGYLPKAIAALANSHEAVVACEGSMFKSSFSNALSGTMGTALAIAANTDNLSVGYGAEIASMDPTLETFVRRNLKKSLVMCRNEPSFNLGQSLGLRVSAGADTAWTFEAEQKDRARTILKELGYDQDTPILIVCPVNPFGGPYVRIWISPAQPREIRRLKNYDILDFSSIRTIICEQGSMNFILLSWHWPVNVIAAEMGANPLIFAMDSVDEEACQDLSRQLTQPASIVHGHHYGIRDAVGLLRCGEFLISSRFHALVASPRPSYRSSVWQRTSGFRIFSHRVAQQIGSSQQTIAICRSASLKSQDQSTEQPCVWQCKNLFNPK